jgi:hypothetical protein
MQKRIVIITVVILMLSLLLTGCGNKSAIIGEWKGDLNSITFFQDGTVNVSILGVGVYGVYEFIDNDTVRISYKENTNEFNVKISGDTLYLESGGVTIKYTKVK